MGNLCQTVVVACVSSSLDNCQQTLNTLRYAQGLKKRRGAKRKDGVSTANGASMACASSDFTPVKALGRATGNGVAPKSAMLPDRRGPRAGHNRRAHSNSPPRNESSSTTSSSTPSRSKRGDKIPALSHARRGHRRSSSEGQDQLAALALVSDTMSSSSNSPVTPPRVKREVGSSWTTNSRPRNASESSSPRPSKLDRTVSTSALLVRIPRDGGGSPTLAPPRPACPRAGQGRHGLKAGKPIPRPGEMACVCSLCNSVVTEHEVYSCKLCRPWFAVCATCYGVSATLGPTGGASVSVGTESLPFSRTASRTQGTKKKLATTSSKAPADKDRAAKVSAAP